MTHATLRRGSLVIVLFLMKRKRMLHFASDFAVSAPAEGNGRAQRADLRPAHSGKRLFHLFMRPAFAVFLHRDQNKSFGAGFTGSVASRFRGKLLF